MVYQKFANEGLLIVMLKDAVSHIESLRKPGTFLKAHSEPKRLLTKWEAYVSHCGYCASHYLSYLQKIENIKIFIDDGTLTKKMKKNNINGYHTLSYNIENFIIRTQGLVERTMILIDAVLDLGNAAQFISYNLIRNNVHIKRLKLDSDLKRMKEVAEKYHYTRNSIIHEREFMDDDLRELEFEYLILGNRKLSEMDEREFRFMKKWVKEDERKIRITWNMDVATYLKNIEPIIESILQKINPIYESFKQNLLAV